MKKYPQSAKVANVEFLIAFTYNNSLQDFDNAKKAYKTFIEKYPDSPLKQSAIFELENLGKDVKDIPVFKQSN